MSRPAAFFFDLDGTLVDTELLWAQAIVNLLGDRGVQTTRDVIAPIVFGHSWLDIHATVHRLHPSLQNTSAAEDAVALRPYYNKLSGDPKALVIPTAVTFLKKAARIAPCAIVSGSPHDDVEIAANLCGVKNCLKFVLGAEDYGRGKPAPDGYLKAAAMLDVDASECIVVEDSSAGVASGRSAGMRVIGIDRNPAIPQNFAGCEWIVHDLSEIDIDVVFADS